MIKLKNILRESPNAAAVDDTIIKISDAIIAEVANSKSRFEAIFTANKMPYTKADGDEIYDDPNYCYQKNTIAMLTALDTYATNIKKLYKEHSAKEDYTDAGAIIFDALEILSTDIKSNIEY
jgi:hypothetical protein